MALPRMKRTKRSTVLELRIPTVEPGRQRVIMSGMGKNGEIAVTTRCFLRNGRPWYPVMGEFHYSRYPSKYWPESIRKILSGGVQVIGTYVFWIHHEEIEGGFDWSGDRDLRRFLSLCGEEDCPVVLRIGPWSHGECRNGGFPDWLLLKPFSLRTDDPGYLEHVRKFWAEISRQAEGLLFRDGGPVVGIQIENEYGHCGGLSGEAGIAHMRTLKRMAVESGFDVPFYTATGWGGAIVVHDELVPVMSAYADAPWTQNVEPLPENGNFRFSCDRNDLRVGNDHAGDPGQATFPWEENPYLMAELGGGNQVTGHRRPVIASADTAAMALVKLGSGANLLGYYMYHGGTNPKGKLTTLQETRETGYPNDVPVLSYDFQAPVREFGRLSASYSRLKMLHLLLNDFGDRIACMDTFIPGNASDRGMNPDGLRCSVRFGNTGGFLFLNNHCRHRRLPSHERLDVTLHRSTGDVIRFSPFPFRDGRFLVFPFDFELPGVRLLSATAQLLCRTDQKGEEYVFFFAYPEIRPVFEFDPRSVRSLSVRGGSVENGTDGFRVEVVKPGTDALIDLVSQDGHAVHLVTLTLEQAENCWKGIAGGRERIVLTRADLRFGADGFELETNERNELDFSLFPGPDGSLFLNGREREASQDGLFARFAVQVPDGEASADTRIVRETNDLLVCELTVKYSAGRTPTDVFLSIDFDGDRAELLCDDEVIADWFSNGTCWEIGLKRFLPFPPESRLFLRVHAAFEDVPVYRDVPLRFAGGRALGLRSVTAWLQFGEAVRFYMHGER